VSEWTFVEAAYGLTWVVLGGFWLYLWRRWVRARVRLESLNS